MTKVLALVVATFQPAFAGLFAGERSRRILDGGLFIAVQIQGFFSCTVTSRLDPFLAITTLSKMAGTIAGVDGAVENLAAVILTERRIGCTFDTLLTLATWTRSVDVS